MSSSSTEDFERIWTCAVCKKSQQKILYSLYLEVQHLVGKFVFDEKIGETWIWCRGCPRHFHFLCVDNLPKNVKPSDITEDYRCVDCGVYMQDAENYEIQT